MKKKNGTIYNVCLWSIMLIFVTVFLVFTMESRMTKLLADQTDNDLVLSVLAGSTINLEDLGSTGKVSVNNIEKNYSDFCEALKTNMQLNDSFQAAADSKIDGQVHIEEFAVYNIVNDHDIEKIGYQNDGNPFTQMYTNQLGTLKTPNNVKIESCTVYAKIGFNIKTDFSTVKYVTKDYCTDIIKE